MFDGPGMKKHAGAGGHQRIGVELLVSECRHVNLVTGNELIEVVHLPSKARTDVIQRKSRCMAVYGNRGKSLCDIGE